MSIFSIAFTLFLLMDSIGNIPLYLSLLKNLNGKRQRFVILRELLIALVVIILFMFIGDWLMTFLQIDEGTIQISGGIILFLICLKMIFPSKDDAKEHSPKGQEPLIVPLAIPFIAGPAVLAAVIIFSKHHINHWVMIGAILMAWVASLIVLLASSYLNALLGWRGLTAIERLMGLILILIAVQMFMNGFHSFQ